MVRAQDGRVSGQVVEVVHDDGHEQVQHLNKLKPVLKSDLKLNGSRKEVTVEQNLPL